MTTWLPRWFALLVLVLPFVPAVAVDNAVGGAAKKAEGRRSALFVVQRVKEIDKGGAPKSNFAVRCLNKDSILLPDELGQLTLKVEISAVCEQEIRLKPGEFRLAILDANLRQLDELAIAIPKDWENKTFKKGENRVTLTFPTIVGDLVEGQTYYLAVTISPSGADGVYPILLRLVKFHVGKTAK